MQPLTEQPARRRSALTVPSFLRNFLRDRKVPRGPSRRIPSTQTERTPHVNSAGTGPGESSRTGERSLFSEILDFMLVPLLILWPVSIGVMFLVARSLADTPFDQALADRVRALSQHLQVADGGVRANMPTDLQVPVPADRADRIWFQVRALPSTPGAAPILLSGEPDLPQLSPTDAPQPGVIGLRTTQWHGEEIRQAYTWVVLSDGIARQTIWVQVAETLSNRNQLTNEIIQGVIVPQFLILPIAITLVWFGLSRGVAPLKALQQKIHERSSDDLSSIDAKGMPDEITPLVDAFNGLLNRMGANLQAQRRFIADAAHQMKTPLAGLQVQAELAMRETDPLQLQRSLEQLALSSQRSTHLINQLLTLARTENAGNQVAFETLNLTSLVRHAVADWVPQALTRNIDLGFETEAEETGLRGQPVLLTELVNNIVDNALRYTPERGSVTVRVRRQGNRLILEVEDTGQGIPPAEQMLVFERFYRVLGNTQNGSGLGLAIVREIAAQHGATVSVCSNPHSTDSRWPGSRFAVSFDPAVPRA